MQKIFKFLYWTLTALATVGGVIGLFQFALSTPDYDLVIAQLSSEKIIENTVKTPELSFHFDGKPIDRLYFTKLQLKNSGKRALTTDFIYEPIRIFVGPESKLLQVNQNGSSVSIADNAMVIRWSLLNPGESICAFQRSWTPVSG
jgi:hypothetical protein